MPELLVRGGRMLQGMDPMCVTNRYAALSREPPSRPVVFVVDRDAAVRNSLDVLIRGEGWQPEMFGSEEEFLSRSWRSGPNCLVLDATLSSFGGLEVQRRVAVEKPGMPVIFTTDQDDFAMVVQAMKAGATEFLMKPLDEVHLVSALRQAIARSEALLDREAELQALRACYGELSNRERDVMHLVVTGRLNKQVGGDLGISEITVKAHRGRVMRKMGAGSLVDLVHMAMRLRLSGGDATSLVWPH